MANLVALDDEEIHLALRAQLEAVAEIPPPRDRAWTNVDFKPDALRPHIESDFVPGPRPVLTMPARGGIVDASGLFVPKYYGLENEGEGIARAVVTAILRAFSPGLTITLPSGNTLRIRSDAAPYPGQILPAGKNKTRCAITIPWRCYAANVAAA